MTHSSVQMPVGPAPMSKTVSSGVISEMRAAQNPVARMSPTNSACSSETPSGQPNAQPPFGSVQLFTQPWRQKKHSPQNVSTLTLTRSPGRTDVTAAPTASTTPTISCPTVMPGTARGTEPCLMCRSLVQMELSVTRTMASRGSAITGAGLSSRAKWPCSM